MSLEDKIDKLTLAITDLTAAMSKGEAAPAKAAPASRARSKPAEIDETDDATPPATTRRKKASKKKAARRPTKEADTDEGDDAMSLEELHSDIATICKDLGPLASEVGTLMNDMGYQDLTSVPDDKRQELHDAVVKLNEELKAEGDDEDESFLG